MSHVDHPLIASHPVSLAWRVCVTVMIFAFVATVSAFRSARVAWRCMREERLSYGDTLRVCRRDTMSLRLPKPWCWPSITFELSNKP